MNINRLKTERPIPIRKNPVGDLDKELIKPWRRVFSPKAPKKFVTM
jgi:hypothetical protein